MILLTLNSQQRLLRILFFASETMFVGSAGALELLWRSYQAGGVSAGGSLLESSFVSSLIMLAAVCYRLRRTATGLTILGWLSIFAVLDYGAKP